MMDPNHLLVGALDHFLCSPILEISSSQLTFIFFNGVGIPLTSLSWFQIIHFFYGSFHGRNWWFSWEVTNPKAEGNPSHWSGYTFHHDRTRIEPRIDDASDSGNHPMINGRKIQVSEILYFTQIDWCWVVFFNDKNLDEPRISHCCSSRCPLHVYTIRFGSQVVLQPDVQL